MDENKVVFTYKDYRKEGKKRIMSLDKMEFVRRFSLHVLPLRFVRIRHFGILNAHSRYSIPDIIDAIEQSGVGELMLSPQLIAEMPYKNTCPICKKGEMIIMVMSKGRDPPPDIQAFYQHRKKHSEGGLRSNVA